MIADVNGRSGAGKRIGVHALHKCTGFAMIHTKKLLHRCKNADLGVWTYEDQYTAEV